MKIIANNKKATFEYFIIDSYKAGIVLEGCEVKSVRLGHVSLNDTFITFSNNGEAYIKNMYIKKYDNVIKDNLIDEKRNRKLLLNKSEISKIMNKVKEKGFTCVPLKVILDGQLVKVEIALAKGKHTYDKHKELAKKDIEMEMKRDIKNYSR